MIFKGTPNQSIIINRKLPLRPLLTTYRIIAFDKNGLLETEDKYIIDVLLRNNFEQVFLNADKESKKEEKPLTAPKNRPKTASQTKKKRKYTKKVNK